MTKAILCGASGRMGRFIAEAAKRDGDITIVAGVDPFFSEADFPIAKTFTEINREADVIIDFSNPAVLDGLLDYALANKIPAVLAARRGFEFSVFVKVDKTAF